MDNVKSVEVAVSIIVALLASVPGILAFIRGMRQDRREGIVIESTSEKLSAEATEALINATKSLLDPLNNRVSVLECKNTELQVALASVKKESEKEIDKLNKKVERLARINVVLCNGVRLLIDQIRELGSIPVFEVDSELCNGGEEDEN